MSYERIQLTCYQDAMINFAETGKTKEEFEKMGWVDQIDFLDMHAHVSGTYIQDWIFIKDKSNDAYAQRGGKS